MGNKSCGFVALVSTIGAMNISTIASGPASELANALHRAGIGMAGVQDEAQTWRLGVERDGRVLWLDTKGKSHRSPADFNGDFLQAYREAIRRMKLWMSLWGCRGYTVRMDPIFDCEIPTADAPR